MKFLVRFYFFTILGIVGVLSAPVFAESVVPRSQAQVKLSYAPIVKHTAPAVVNVYTSKVVRERSLSPFGNDPFFRRFFGNEGFLGGREKKRRQSSLGSGVIVEASGFIITNNHVIKGGNDFRVVLSDKREFKAKLLLQDPKTDLAILKIDPRGKKLPTLELGDSDKVEVGDLVLAIGNPFGVGQTVTSGIVSALARNRVGVSSYQFFIQTDAAINPGNSGGALVDMEGRLVGINTAIYTRSGGSNGIGFAIPVNMVKSVIRSSRAGGKIVRPWAGVGLQEVSQDIADSVGLDRPRGAMIARLHRASPLRKSGLKRGDIIVSMDGKNLESAKEFTYRFATKVIGDDIEMVVLRRRRKITAIVAAEQAPETTPRNETSIRVRSPFSGLVVANVSPAVTSELGIENVNSGVIVTGFKRGLAARAGFRKGDVIVEVNGVSIDRVRTLLRVVRADDDTWWDITLRRKGRLRRMRFGG
jgi:serine protease Do